MTAPGPYAEANNVMVQLTRLACGWSRKRLADEVGVSASHVSKVESGVLPLAGKALLDYARVMQCSPEALCVPFTRSPAEGTHFRANTSIAEWKRDRVWARANLRRSQRHPCGRLLQLMTFHYFLAIHVKVTYPF